MREQRAFQNSADWEQRLRNGEVIELAMSSDAVGLLQQNDQGKFRFVWVTCYHGRIRNSLASPLRQWNKSSCGPSHSSILAV